MMESVPETELVPAVPIDEEINIRDVNEALDELEGSLASVAKEKTDHITPGRVPQDNDEEEGDVELGKSGNARLLGGETRTRSTSKVVSPLVALLRKRSTMLRSGDSTENNDGEGKHGRNEDDEDELGREDEAILEQLGLFNPRDMEFAFEDGKFVRRQIFDGPWLRRRFNVPRAMKFFLITHAFSFIMLIMSAIFERADGTSMADYIKSLTQAWAYIPFLLDAIMIQGYWTLTRGTMEWPTEIPFPEWGADPREKKATAILAVCLTGLCIGANFFLVLEGYLVKLPFYYCWATIISFTSIPFAIWMFQLYDRVMLLTRRTLERLEPKPTIRDTLLHHMEIRNTQESLEKSTQPMVDAYIIVAAMVVVLTGFGLYAGVYRSESNNKAFKIFFFLAWCFALGYLIARLANINELDKEFRDAVGQFQTVKGKPYEIYCLVKHFSLYPLTYEIFGGAIAVTRKTLAIYIATAFVSAAGGFAPFLKEIVLSGYF